MISLVSYIRSFLMAIIYPVFLLGMSLLTICLNFIFHQRRIDDAMISLWGRISCRLFGVRVHVKGLENIPLNKGCLFLFNHTSFFDIFSMIGFLPGVRFGAKIELFKIPLFGYAMRRVGVLPIDRANREEVFKVYESAKQRLINGERFALAPEGTRQETEALGEFKSGPFIFAISAQALIVPVVIRGASAILPKHSLLPNAQVWTRDIHIQVLPPVDATQFSIDNKDVLQDRIHLVMSEHLAGI